jgi:arylsulfatase A-like enzyme
VEYHWDREAFLAAYDGEIASVDRALDRLLDAVPAERRSRTLLVIAGDHPGNEIQAPMGVVILGGLLSSTALDRKSGV